MSVIQVDIDDALIQSIGAYAIKSFIEQQVDILRLQHQGSHIAQIVRESGIDHAQEVNEARQEAWDEYKAEYLKDIL